MKRLALALMALAGLGVLPAAAHAVVPGPNGPFAFASGRDDGGTAFTDTAAQLWVLNPPGATANRVSSGFDSYLHRHPTWSPDRTKIAYARCTVVAAGCIFAGPWHIYVQDLLHGGVPTDITPAAMSADRPAWAPDGTRIAYAKQTAAANWDIDVRSASGAGGETTVATAASTEAGGWKQARAQWTPDSRTLIYAKEYNNTPTDYDIYRAPANGSDTFGTLIDSHTTNDYQPAVSADGSKICFTHDTGAPNFKNIIIEPIAGGARTTLVATTGDEFECAWSPDGRKVAFGRGATSVGQILTRNVNGTGEALVTDVAGRFDGNPDWAQNPPPFCAHRDVTTPLNKPVSIPLACSDTRDPPSFLAPHIVPVLASNPGQGALGAVAGDGSVTYTPSGHFKGTDSFTYRGSDGTSNAALATVTINVVGHPTKASFKGTKSSLRASRKRRFKFSFHATPGLTGSAVFTTIKKIRLSSKKGRKKKITIARKSFTVKPSGKVTLTIKLSKKRFRILKLNRKIRTRLTVTLKNGFGLKTKATKRITLKAPKRRRH